MLNTKFELWMPKSQFFALMASQKTDFTLTFRGLGGELDGRGDGARALFSDPAAFDQWAERWHARIAREPRHDAGRLERMRAANPKYIPRNHRIEEAIRAAEDRGDFAPFEDLARGSKADSTWMTARTSSGRTP